MPAHEELPDFDEFTRAYIEAMLWAETSDDGAPLDKEFDIQDLSMDAINEIMEDCTDFQADNADDIADDLRQAGRDFYLTRNRHGAGFWDGDWSDDIGKRLTDKAHTYGTQGLYVGDDGRLYTHN